MAVQDKLGAEELKQYYNSSDEIRLSPGWVGREHGAAPELEPFMWRWSDVEPLVLKSGEIVTPDRDVERRTMRLATPGLNRGTTHTMIAALQLLLPGECAPSHRHTHGYPMDLERRRCIYYGGRRQMLDGARRSYPDPILDLARPY